MRPYPQPLGNDGKLPLLSSNADTFHAANAHRGTTVRDCYFVNAGEMLHDAQPTPGRRDTLQSLPRTPIAALKLAIVS